MQRFTQNFFSNTTYAANVKFFPNAFIDKAEKILEYKENVDLKAIVVLMKTMRVKHERNDENYLILNNLICEKRKKYQKDALVIAKLSQLELIINDFVDQDFPEIFHQIQDNPKDDILFSKIFIDMAEKLLQSDFADENKDTPLLSKDKIQQLLQYIRDVRCHGTPDCNYLGLLTLIDETRQKFPKQKALLSTLKARIVKYIDKNHVSLARDLREQYDITEREIADARCIRAAAFMSFFCMPTWLCLDDVCDDFKERGKEISASKRSPHLQHFKV